MGFLGDLVEDVFDVVDKTVRLPARVIFCNTDDHRRERRPDGSLKCSICGATSKGDR